MKKYILSIALAAASIVGMNAQGQTGGSFGARIAWDLNSPSSNLTGLGNGSGFSVGGVYNLPISKGWYFEPGLNFFYNTMDINIPDFSPSYYWPENSYQPLRHAYESTLRNYGFRVPITFGYLVELVDNIDVSIFTGPQINLNLSMSEHTHHNFSKLYDKGYNRFDAQWLFGVRVHYKNNVFVEIDGGIGMTNLLTSDHRYNKNSHLRRNTFSIGVGYMF